VCAHIYIYIYLLRERRYAYRVLAGKPERRRLLERPRHRWEDNIKIDLREVGWGMDWVDLSQEGASGGLL
jgi:hypothetical protein